MDAEIYVALWLDPRGARVWGAKAWALLRSCASHEAPSDARDLLIWPDASCVLCCVATRTADVVSLGDALRLLELLDQHHIAWLLNSPHAAVRVAALELVQELEP